MSIELESRVEMLERRLSVAYSERNALAIGFVNMALRMGWPAGRGIDGKTENDMQWRHVVYAELPTGEQLSWHIAPAELNLLEGMPCYRGEWNGEFTGKNPEWVALLGGHDPRTAAELAEAYLAGFAYDRWHIEREKLTADKDVSFEDGERILKGYALAWRKKI